MGTEDHSSALEAFKVVGVAGYRKSQGRVYSHYVSEMRYGWGSGWLNNVVCRAVRDDINLEAFTSIIKLNNSIDVLNYSTKPHIISFSCF